MRRQAVVEEVPPSDGACPVFTVRLCNDLTGWFASLSDDVAEYPGVTVQSEQGFETHDEAFQALDLTQVLAQRLTGSAGTSTRVQASPFAPDRNRASAPAFVGRRTAVRSL
jgi:hypothetical protein